MKTKVKRKTLCPLGDEGVRTLSQINNKLDTLLEMQSGLAKSMESHYERIRYCIYGLENRKGV